MKHIYVILSLALLLVTNAGAGDGTLDPSFGTAGVSTITLPAGLTLIQSTKMFIDSRARIYINGANFLTRLTPTGQLDTTFNQSGTNPGYVAFPATIAVAYNVLVQPDNKILVCGRATDNSTFITRFNDDGSFDQTFNNGQIVFTSIPADFFNIARAIALQTDGKIVVTVEAESQANLTLIRYNTDGSLDTAFGTGGIVQTLLIGAELGVTTSIGITPQGEIIVIGYAFISELGSSPVTIAARYTTNGTLDTSFAATSTQPGIFISDPIYAVTPTVAGVPSVALQPDGKVVIGTTISPNSSSMLIRLTQQGVLDGSFNGTGLSQIIAQSASFQSQIVLQSDGKIVLIATDNSLVARFTANGLIDTTFASPNGYILTPDTPSFAGVSIEQNGYIVTAGTSSGTVLIVTRYQVATPLVKTSISTLTPNSEGGSAQSNSIVTLYVDGQEVCVTESVNNTWSCTATITPGLHTLEAVAHYPAGNVNLAKTCLLTFPMSALTTAVISKYCAC